MSNPDVVDGEIVDKETGEVTETRPAVQMRGEVLRAEDVQISTQQALAVANELKGLVRDRGWVSNIQGHDYLNVEAWMFIGGKFGISASTEIEFLRADGEIIAVLAKASLKDRRTGDVIAEATQTCNVGGRFAELNHAVGMAQTRAISRAYQQQYRWIAKMAGYEGTPAEEMDGVETRRQRPPRQSSPPSPPARAEDAPGSEPDWFDTNVGFGKKVLAGKPAANHTWRTMCEGSYGGERWEYLDFMANKADRIPPAKKERAKVCLSIYEARRNEADDAALSHESDVPF